ncbi:MAG: FHA domain-containing protein [bacterium]|nr:FHA domain-containing protein [bacterium]
MEQWSITIVVGNQMPRKYRLDDFKKDTVWFGREASNDIVISSGLVSAKHGCFIHRQDGWWIVDANSTNGIYIGQYPCKESLIASGAVYRIDDVNSALAEGVSLFVECESSPYEWKQVLMQGRNCLTIGRAADCDIVLSHVSVSKHHAKIVFENGRYVIYDLDSTNGISVNGIMVQRRRELRERDVIVITTTKLIFGMQFVAYQTAVEGIHVAAIDVVKTVKVKNKKMKNESFSVASYGKTVSYLCDYSTDRYEVMKAYDAIEYKKQNTYTNQIIYDLIKEFTESSDKCFRRILLFNDGQDGNKDGVTQQELLDYLDEHSYPILILGCQNDTNADALKELFAISREVKTDYFTFTSKTDIKPIVNAVQKISRFEAVTFPLSHSDSDGSIKNLKLEISLADGTRTVTKDIRTKMDTGGGKMENESIFIILCSVIGAAAVLTIIIILVKMRKQNTTKKSMHQEAPQYQMPLQMPPQMPSPNYNQGFNQGYQQSYNPGYQQKPIQQPVQQPMQQPMQQYPRPEGQKTVFIPKAPEASQTDQTTLLQNNVPVSYMLKLTDKQTQRCYVMKFTKELVVGRDPNVAGLVIPDDRSVSKKHFKLTEELGTFYIEDLHSSNHTIVNGVQVTSKMELKNGDLVTVGRGTYQASIEQNGVSS